MPAKRVVCLLGSPRSGGNSDRLAEALIEELRAKGAFVECYALRELSYSGCRNLFHCKEGGDRCGLSDGLSPILEAVREADVLVLASPIYFTDITSDLKAAIERFFSFLVPDYPAAEIKTLAEPIPGAQSKPAQASVVVAGGCFWCVEAVF